MENIKSTEDLEHGLILFFDINSKILDTSIDDTNKLILEKIINRLLVMYNIEDETRIGFVGDKTMMTKWLAFIMSTIEEYKFNQFIDYDHIDGSIVE